MAKALFIYTLNAGKGKIGRKVPYILKRLHSKFEVVDVKSFSTMEEGEMLAKASCGQYEALIVAGGDGTFNRIVNAVFRCDGRPILGFIGTGTLCDVGANFGSKRNIRKCMDIICNGKTKNIDLLDINGRAAVYLAACGAFADISFMPRKKLGRLSYYLAAVREAFKYRKYKVTAIIDGKEMTFNTPFVLVLNGKWAGGFKVNRKGEIDDGLMDIYIAPPGLFNGLVSYFFFHIGVKHIQAREATFSMDKELTWCLDGEKGDAGISSINTIKNAIKIYSK